MGGDGGRIRLIVRIGSRGEMGGVSLIVLVLRRRPVSTQVQKTCTASKYDGVYWDCC